MPRRFRFPYTLNSPIRLPESRQPGAWGCLDRFSYVFNAGLPLVQNLYECQRNPFLSADGHAVDLTGGGGSGGTEGRMGPHTPVAFSLPSQPPGDVDAAGLTTIMLLRRLEAAHNDALRLFRHAAPVTAPTVQQGALFGATSALTLSCATAPSLARRALLAYARAKHLMPLAAKHCLQPLGEVGAGGPLAFDGRRLEDDLASALR